MSATHSYTSAIQDAWDAYNAHNLDGDEFACLVATMLQLTGGAGTFASEKTAKDAPGLPSGLTPPPSIIPPSGPGVPDSGSVGPWKEVLYKHPDAPSGDAKRLLWIKEAMDGIGDVDFHEQAALNAFRNDHDEPDDDDYLDAIRIAIDVAIKRHAATTSPIKED